MGAMVINSRKIELNVLPLINEALSNINTAETLNYNLNSSLPSSFIYKNKINDFVNEIALIKKDTKELKEQITLKINKLNNIQRNYEDSVGSLLVRTNQLVRFQQSNNANIIYNDKETVSTSTSETAASFVKKQINLIKNSDMFKALNNIGTRVINRFTSIVDNIGDMVNSAKNWAATILSNTDFLQNLRNETGATYSKSVTEMVFDAIGSGIDYVGTKISNGFNTAVDWVSDKATTSANWIKGKWRSVKSWGKKIFNSAKEQLKKIGASIANAVISFTKGIVSFLESLLDGLVLLGSAASTVITGAVDIVRGVSTGNWDWKITKGMWSDVKSTVSYNITDKAFDSIYNTKAGKWLDDNAYAPFKSDGIACKICEKVGYVTGVVAFSVVTCGAGLSFGSTASIGNIAINSGATAITAGVAGFGKNTQQEWNSNTLNLKYDNNDMEIAIDYEKYLAIENLSKGKSVNLTQKVMDADGNVKDLVITITAMGNGEYDIIDSDGYKPTLTLNESSTLKGLGVGLAKGAFEGFQYYTVISTIGNLQGFASLKRKTKFIL